MAKKKTVVEEPIKETDVIDVTDITVDTEAIKESIQNVDVTLESDLDTKLVEIENRLNEEIKPLQEIKEQVTELINNKEMEKSFEMAPEKAEEHLKREIKKAEELKAKVKTIIKDTNSRNFNMTNWWNGMGYDF